MKKRSQRKLIHRLEPYFRVLLKNLNNSINFCWTLIMKFIRYFKAVKTESHVKNAMVFEKKNLLKKAGREIVWLRSIQRLYGQSIEWTPKGKNRRRKKETLRPDKPISVHSRWQTIRILTSNNKDQVHFGFDLIWVLIDEEKFRVLKLTLLTFPGRRLIFANQRYWKI